MDTLLIDFDFTFPNYFYSVSIPSLSKIHRLCNWSHRESLTLEGIDRGRYGCSHMGGLPVLHVNTTLFILISALYADARLCKASSARTKKRARECAVRCASKFTRGGGFGRDRMCKQLHPRRMMPKNVS
jgi:hypothetical protein